MSTIVFHGGRKQAHRVVRALVASLSGAARTDAARSVFITIGMAALSDIHADFIRKARGQVGEDGVKWKRLSPKTLAYSRRFGSGEQAALKRAAGLGPGNRFAPGNNKGLLTAAELKRWRKYFAMHLARLAARHPLAEAKGMAAGIAWNKLKAEGAKTKLEVYGNREHEVLRDTGVLANSLSVGVMSGSQYQRPFADGGEEQIFSLLDNGIIVGTNVPYARAHHEGHKGLPKRPIVPEPQQVPSSWLLRWATAGMRAIGISAEQALQRGSI